MLKFLHIVLVALLLVDSDLEVAPMLGGKVSAAL
jgi:hypothetical protein